MEMKSINKQLEPASTIEGVMYTTKARNLTLYKYHKICVLCHFSISLKVELDSHALKSLP